jgi:hypothetical protein
MPVSIHCSMRSTGAPAALHSSASARKPGASAKAAISAHPGRRQHAYWEVGLAGGQFAKLGHGLILVLDPAAGAVPAADNRDVCGQDLVGRAHTSRVRSAPWHADDLAGVGLTAESMIPAQARAGSGDGR